MKIGNRKIPKGNVLLLLGIFVIAVCTLLISAAFRVDYINGLKTGNFYSERARKMWFTDCSRSDIWLEIMDKIPEDVTIYHQIWDNETEIYSIYNQTQTDAFPLLSGRFFSKENHLESSPTVVIGRAFQDSLLREGEETYWEYEGTLYRVLGIMGMSYESKYDELVLINFASELSQREADGAYLIDGRRKQDIDAAVSTIKTYFLGHVMINVAAKSGNGWINMTYDGMQFGTIFYILILLSFFLTLMIMDSVWLSYRRNAVRIYRMQGLFGREIFWLLLREFECILLMAWGIGLLAGIFVAHSWEDIALQPWDIFLSLSVTQGFGFLTFLLPFYQMRKIRAAEG